ncbi:MAG TPA: hypothetical protein VHB21_09480 [Minicystis sp.]|nr:hypothetical protein [Minicystis sp.]
MRCDHLVVFEDFIANATEYHSDAELDLRLGRFDQIALYCALSDVPAASFGTATVSVWLSHSGDGATFVAKNGSGGPPPSNAEITFNWTTKPSTALTGWGSDPNANITPATPMLRHVRVNIYMQNASGPVRARIYATLRDVSPSAARLLGGGASPSTCDGCVG